MVIPYILSNSACPSSKYKSHIVFFSNILVRVFFISVTCLNDCRCYSCGGIWHGLNYGDTDGSLHYEYK